MAYRNEGPFTIISGEALEADRLVKISSSEVVYADAGEEPIGLTEQAVADATLVAMYPLRGNIEKVTGSKAITAGLAIYVAADGKVSDAAVGKQIGILLTAITADGGKGSAIVWGPRGGNDALSARGTTIDFFDDFFQYDPTATVGKWVAVEDAGATGGDKVIDGAGGLLSAGCDGDDEDEVYISSIVEFLKFAANKMMFFETSVELTEANTNEANWIIGLSDTVGADSLVDAGAGPMASYDGAVFFKVDGTMKIQFENSNAGTQVTNATLADFVSGTRYKLGFLFDPNDGVTGKITPFVDGVAGTVQDITLAGLEEMHILIGTKAGGTNEEALVVDYVHCVQVR